MKKILLIFKNLEKFINYDQSDLLRTENFEIIYNFKSSSLRICNYACNFFIYDNVNILMHYRCDGNFIKGTSENDENFYLLIDTDLFV